MLWFWLVWVVVGLGLVNSMTYLWRFVVSITFVGCKILGDITCNGNVGLVFGVGLCFC